MTKKHVLLLALLAPVMAFDPSPAHSWCWKRDTGRSGETCLTGSFVQTCCDGNLEFWPGATITYRVSASSDSARLGDILDGFKKWNDIEMSALRFVNDPVAPTDPAWAADQDGVNLVNLDKDFCQHYADYCGMGVLGFSATYTQVRTGVYQAIEADIILNGSEFTWGGAGSKSPVIDTVAVTAHEGGHNAGLSHPGSACRSSGSSGCGEEVEAATMYWNYSAGQPTDKSSLELDDIAAMVHGYPVSNLQVRVVDETTGLPIEGATVMVNGTAFPLTKTDVSPVGGYVYGDITSMKTLVGDHVASPSYDSAKSHFTPTDANGFTDVVNPVTRVFTVKAIKDGAGLSQEVTMADGDNLVTLSLNTSPDVDYAGPVLSITSHVDNPNPPLKVKNITLSGTVSDQSRGARGVSAVFVNGERADNDTAVGAATANWSKPLVLSEGWNTITVRSIDDSINQNVTERTIAVNVDTTGPKVTSISPALSIVDPATNPVIAVKFNEQVDPATLTVANIFSVPALPAVYVYDADTSVLSISPTATLAGGASYKFSILNNIKDLAGNSLQDNYSYTLSTTAGTTPEPKPGTNPNYGNAGGNGPDLSSSGCFINALGR